MSRECTAQPTLYIKSIMYLQCPIEDGIDETLVPMFQKNRVEYFKVAVVCSGGARGSSFYG